MDPGETAGTIDPNNPENIRACERCHDIGTLHTLKTFPGFPGGAQEAHFGDFNAWEAVGFHAGGGGDEPTTYRTFSADEQCFGCHGELISAPPAVDVCTGYLPSIADITPKSGACYTYVTVTGLNFGEEQYDDSFVQIKQSGTGYPWVNLPASSWTETQIACEIPCWTFTKGNYKVRVQTNCGNSNKVNFALKDWGTLLTVLPDKGPCGTWLTLTGSGFTGSRRDTTTTVGDTGIERFVKLVASQGQYLVKKYRNWTDTQVEAKFYNLSQDDNEDYLEDVPIKKCSGGVSTWLGSYEVYFVTVYYEEGSGDGAFGSDDTIRQVTISDPEIFELTGLPVIFRLNPDKIDRGSRLKIAGQNFGPYQTDGVIKVGRKAQYNPDLCRGKTCYKDDPTLLPIGGKIQDKNVFWSNTLLKVKFKVPTKWQGKNRFVWVEKDGKASPASRITINP
jgi:hypothetical protein